MTDPASEHDLDRLATAFEQHLPDLRPVRPLSVLGRGFRSVAVETPGGVVLRVGQSPDAADDYTKEWQIGRFLAGHVPDLLPEPRWYIEPCPDFPHGALGYKKLPGDPPAWGVDPGPAQRFDQAGARIVRIDEVDDCAPGDPVLGSCSHGFLSLQAALAGAIPTAVLV